MAFTPAPPFPKSRGDIVRSTDWNDAINELLRLDTAKVNKAGDAMTGPLTVAGNVGIGTTNPTYKLHVGTGNQGLRIEGPGSAGGTSVSLGGNGDFSIDAPGVVGGRFVVKDGGSVGIGTTTPAAKLQVANGAIMPSAGNNEQSGILFPPDPEGGSGDRAWMRYYPRSGEAMTLEIGIANDPDDHIALMPSGNVGIGTSGPNYLLSFGSNLANTKLAIWDGGANGMAFGLGVQNSQFRFHLNQASDRFSFLNGADGLEIATFLGTGNVGIGTRGPKSMLDVNGDISVNGVDVIRRDGTNAYLFPWSTGYANNLVFIGGGSNTNLRVTGGATIDGNVGIGTTTPGAKLGIVGDVRITGHLGTSGFSPNPVSPNWGGGIHTFDLEAEGTCWCPNGFISGAHDLAENYESNMVLEPGDVVSLDQDTDKLRLSDEPDDVLVLGVVSTAPGFLLDASRKVVKKNAFPVALSGRVPCKVVDQNGSIRRGDLLTTSSKPGYAMKAKPIQIEGQDLYRTGTIIGKALSSLESGEGLIEIFVCSR